MTRPLILVVGRWTDHQGRPGREGIFSTRTVMDAVSRAGGEPVLGWPDTLERAERLVALSDGVILPGGNDLDLRPFGIPDVHPREEHSPPEQDAVDVSVARAALAAERPILAICRGMQVLNVAADGSLIQDLPSQVPTALPHAIDESLTTLAHGLEVLPDTHLARAVAAGLPAMVNSRHHQAVKVLGNGLAISAFAPDGVVEAIEAPSLPFCVGVQWHPENFWRTGEFLPLFRLFAAACEQRTPVHM